MHARRTPIVLGGVLAVLLFAVPAHALRVTTWNLLNYPGSIFSTRQPNFRTVMANLPCDVIVVQEMTTQAGADSFLAVLQSVQPLPSKKWKLRSYIVSCESAIYYDSLTVTIVGIPVALPTSGPRDVLRARVRPIGYTTLNSSFLIYSVHTKAGAPSPTCSPMPCQPDSETRRLECADIRADMNGQTPGTHMLVAGDFNFYGDYEGGYQRLVESQLDNDGRCQDPIVGMTGTWNDFNYRFNHTQCPCVSCLAGGGFSGGGLDDRFDLILPTTNFYDGSSFDLVPSTYAAFGNDGQHYNTDINAGGFNNAVGITVANALHDASDHIPVVVTIQVPAKAYAASHLEFGTAIVGATANQSFAVSNLAPVPGDELNYTFAAPSGFGAPAGPQTVNAGAAPNNHTLSMSTGSAGPKSGTLTWSTNDPDSASKSALLSGLVVDHAVASLDSESVATGGSVDFGDHQAGQFSDVLVAVSNHATGNPQARLSVNSGTITGGAGRFTIVGGFTGGLVDPGTNRFYTLHFDDAGATPDSVYNATLTFGSSDEALPGATAASDLVVSLRAKPLSGSTAVPGDTPPHALAFLPPHPNPLGLSTTFTFDLPQRAPVSLAIYDLTGRRLATLASTIYDPGRYHIDWLARDDQGRRLSAGLYFARFAVPGFTRMARIAVLP